MWKLSCGAVLIVLVGATQAIPACEDGCKEDGGSQYCASTCYGDETNTLYTITTKFGTTTPKCTVGTVADVTCPDLSTDFTFDNCQAQCTADESCSAFIQDKDIAGDRCTFLNECKSMSDAGVLIPCEDCVSTRTCSSCPSFEYKSGSTMVHWLCEMNGDAYSVDNKPAEGTVCKPTAECAASEDGTPKPSSITCVTVEAGQDGKWVDTVDNTDVSPELIADIACECNDLRIPEATDTNVFCNEEHQVTDGNYIITTVDQCEMVCDGQVFIPITCSFAEDKSSASWHIKFDGEDVNLGADTTCLACSLDNCQEDNPTEDPLIDNY